MWRQWEYDFEGITDNNDGNIVAEATLDQSPPKPVLNQPPVNRARKFLSYEEKECILSIYNKLKSDGEPHALKKTAEVTETPKSTVWKVIKYGPKKRKERCDKGMFAKLTPTHTDLIRKKVDELYKNNTVPTISILYNQLTADGSIRCTQRTLQRFVKKQCLMKSEVNSRYDYLKTKKNVSSHRSAFFLSFRKNCSNALKTPSKKCLNVSEPSII
jgi:hypothetical protein